MKILTSGFFIFKTGSYIRIKNLKIFFLDSFVKSNFWKCRIIEPNGVSSAVSRIRQCLWIFFILSTEFFPFLWEFASIWILLLWIQKTRKCHEIGRISILGQDLRCWWHNPKVGHQHPNSSPTSEFVTNLQRIQNLWFRSWCFLSWIYGFKNDRYVCNVKKIVEGTSRMSIADEYKNIFSIKFIQSLPVLNPHGSGYKWTLK